MPQEEDAYVAVDFGAAIRAARNAAGVTQQRVATIMGVDRSYVSRVENGKKNLSLSGTAAFAAAVGCVIVVTLVPTSEASIARP